jgi:hypothetical protein
MAAVVTKKKTTKWEGHFDRMHVIAENVKAEKTLRPARKAVVRMASSPVDGQHGNGNIPVNVAVRNIQELGLVAISGK